MAFAAAQWTGTGDGVIELRPDGRVFEAGKLVFVLDSVGRSLDSDYEPVALLYPRGELLGNGGSNWGHVGYRNAAPPGSSTAWLTVLPDGKVVYFDFDGEEHAGGQWRGCQPAAVRACTYVTHLFAMRDYQQQLNSRVTVGIGLGWYY